MKALMGTSYINELLKIVQTPDSSDSLKVAIEDILIYVQNLEDIAVKLALAIASDRD